MAEAVATRGYGAASVADVIEIAGVSRKTFYEQFADKDTCFRTAYEAIADYLLQMMIAAGIAHRPGPARRRAQLVRFLDGLVADPHSARAFLVEALAAGPRALELREKIIAKYERAAFGGTGHPIHRAAIIGGILTVVASEVRAGRIARLPGLVDALAAFMERALARSRPAKTNRARR